MNLEYLANETFEKSRKTMVEKTSAIQEIKTIKAFAEKRYALRAFVGLVFALTSVTGCFIPPAKAASNSLILAQSVPSNLRSSFGEVIDKFYALDSKVKSGMNYSDYSREVGNLKVAFDRLGRKPGAKKFISYKHLGAALINYQDAASAWEICIQGYEGYCSNNVIPTDSSMGKILMNKYKKIPTTAILDESYFFLNNVLSKIWSVASGHIQNASKKL